MEEGDGQRLADIPVAGQRIRAADEGEDAVKLLHQAVSRGSGGGDRGIEGERLHRILQHRGFQAKDQKNIDNACICTYSEQFIYCRLPLGSGEKRPVWLCERSSADSKI